jgi:hypothetical protein
MRAVQREKLRVLIANVAAEDARLRSILHGDDLQFVRTTRQIEQALEGDPFDLGVVCVQFDESRMFETLRYIQNRNAHRLPVACMRGDSASKRSFSLERYRHTVSELGADALIDFTVVPNGSAGNDLIRRQLYGCVRPGDRRRRSTVYTRALQDAMDYLGSRERLAGALAVTLEDLAQWMEGAAFPPYTVHMRALDIIADHSASSTTRNVVPGTTMPPRAPGSTLP